MEQKRNKLWREQQCKRVFKARMIYYASFEHDVIDDEGNLIHCKHSVNHVFLSPTSIINFTSKKQSYDDTRRSSRDNELLQRAQSDL